MKQYIATRNACKLCTPLGACLAYKGIEACIPIIHGSQGCATYIRRYMISHFREPVDIASSNFDESATIFGGKKNCHAAINNVVAQYKPKILALCTTCLSETIGDDVQHFLKEYMHETVLDKLPIFVAASTPSYQGSHADGFHEAVLATVSALAKRNTCGEHINIFPGLFSPADLRYIKDVLNAFGIGFVMLPDYSDTLDGSSWEEYKHIPDGGTTLSEIEHTGNALCSVQFGKVFNIAGKTGDKKMKTAASFLDEKFGIDAKTLLWPLGVEACDQLFALLSSISGRDVPLPYRKERGRLIDAYADGHKYVFGKKAVVYGEEDLVIAFYRFLTEIGMDVAVVASGGKSRMLKDAIAEIAGNKPLPVVMDDTDFEAIAAEVDGRSIDLFIGHSKGYYIARKLEVPLVRIGFPVHDRLGGQRIRHIGYEGTNELFERIVNALIESSQNKSEVGYKYM